MNKEIKFRCWHKQTSTMMLPTLITFDTINEIFRFPYIGEIYVGRLDEIEEYTGFKDHRGHEIYDGDIIKLSYTKGHERDSSYDYYGYYKVVFHNGQWELAGPFPNYREEKESNLSLWLESSTYLKEQGMEEFAIAGNIHKNVELLERIKI